MDYIFGTVTRNGVTAESLKTIGPEHTDLTGFQQIVRSYPDSITVDNFRVVEKYLSDTDVEGNCYDWYVIDNHNSYVDKYTPASASIQQAEAVAAITFVTLAETGSIDDVTAGEHPETFSAWAHPISYKAGNIRRFEEDGKLYRCLQAHTSQEDWTPPTAPSLWKEIGDPSSDWPDWSQPIGAGDAYQQGDKVTHNGKHWTSTTDNNVWEPGVYGWTEEPQDE